MDGGFALQQLRELGKVNRSVQHLGFFFNPGAEIFECNSNLHINQHCCCWRAFYIVVWVLALPVSVYALCGKHSILMQFLNTERERKSVLAASVTLNDGEFTITGMFCGTFIQLSEKFASPVIKRTAIRGRCTGGGTIRGAVNERRLVAFGTSGPGVAANCINYRIKWCVHLKCSMASENRSWPNWMNPACWRILLCNIWKWMKWKQA